MREHAHERASIANLGLACVLRRRPQLRLCACVHASCLVIQQSHLSSPVAKGGAHDGAGSRPETARRNGRALPF
eukprot:6211842-Pleurochrysis_carterae.AAC.1